MRVITCNVNGIRSAAKKGFFEWVKTQQADFICLQETKAHLSRLEHLRLHLEDYHCFYVDAEKPGYSGVAVYTPHQPTQVVHQLGWPCADTEGRYLQLDFPQLRLISLYLPSGTSGEHRQQQKFDFMARFQPILANFRQGPRSTIICGDWNIAHQPIDLKNWRANQKNSGFLPEERAWLSHLFDEMGWVDAFRVLNQAPEQYTWWSSRGQARAKNVGWRIDYQIVTPDLKDKITSVMIYQAQHFSDHAPLIIDYQDLSLS